jgi:hypothetical protein
LNIQTATIGLAVKDLSETNFVEIEVNDTKIGVALFQKKPEFGPAKTIIAKLRLTNYETKYIVESGSKLIVSGREIETNDKAAKEMMAGMY